MNTGTVRRYVCPRCGAGVIVSESYNTIGAKTTEYKCISCPYYHCVDPVGAAMSRDGWSWSKENDLPIVAPDNAKEE